MRRWGTPLFQFEPCVWWWWAQSVCGTFASPVFTSLESALMVVTAPRDVLHAPTAVFIALFASFALIVLTGNQTPTSGCVAGEESVFRFSVFLPLSLLSFSLFSSLLLLVFVFSLFPFLLLFSCTNTQWFCPGPTDSPPPPPPVYVNEFITGKLASVAADGREGGGGQQ